jgi:hypothetical protein
MLCSSSALSGEVADVELSDVVISFISYGLDGIKTKFDS